MPDTLTPELLEAARQRLETIDARIAAACARVGRERSEVNVIGASKRQPLVRIAAAVCAGLEWLGENYVQEARDKQGPLTECLAAHFGAAPAPTPRWRLIGNLQRNKARQAVELFDAIDTLDRANLAVALDKRAAEAGVTLPVCAQVNVSGEAQKSGVSEADLPALLAACAQLEHLRVVGLMAVPAALPDPEARRASFSRLRALRDTLRAAPGGEHLSELSMGMSGDYEIAVEEGATWIRVGTALFGERDQAGGA